MMRGSMKKLRSNSAWRALSAEQRAKLEAWLFEQHLSYRQALESVKAEFGMRPSLTSLKMFGRRLAAEREEREGRMEVLKWIGKNGDDGKSKKLRSVAEALAMTKMVELSARGPGNGYELAALCRAMTASQRVDLETEKLRSVAERAKPEAALSGDLMVGEDGNAAKVSFGQLKSG
jgi:hypothetical protein